MKRKRNKLKNCSMMMVPLNDNCPCRGCPINDSLIFTCCKINLKNKKKEFLSFSFAANVISLKGKIYKFELIESEEDKHLREYKTKNSLRTLTKYLMNECY